jgi:hypothetical protein
MKEKPQAYWQTRCGQPYRAVRNIEATNPPTHVDYLAEAALRISVFTFLISTFGTAFTVLLGWRSDREFKLKTVQLEAQVAELKRQSLKDKAGPSQPSS